MSKADVDLTFIDPHRRGQVKQRIAAVEEYISAPGDGNAERLAKVIGLTTASFYNLVKAWKATRDPARMQGSGQEKRSHGLSDEQTKIFERVVCLHPQEAGSVVIEAILSEAQKLGMPMPRRAAMRSNLDRLRQGTSKNIPEGITHVIDHCDLNVPVMAQSGAPMRPTLSALISVREPSIFAAVLYIGAPEAALMTGILYQMKTGETPIPVGMSILMDAPSSQPWDDVRRAFNGIGSSIAGEKLDDDAFHEDKGALRKRGNGRTMLALLGRYTAGYKMTVRNGTTKPARMKAGAQPMSIDEARELVLARIAAERRGIVSKV